ncbi:MAG: ABC transporter ATP-binding protein [Chitinophagaceae bacterium]|nr:ABC transporter ATP-binding protein [Chitinophagaceae bacterium]MCW5928607.1 ABC transporter ATP-binding protein [Chitinophagaceae bacterium]
MLQLSGVSKKNETGFQLNNISFTQQYLQPVAIAGETGSGKSTILKIIGGLVQPDTGSVIFEDSRVKGPHEQLIPGHPRIAYLSQHFELRNHYRVAEELDYVNKLTEESADSIFGLCRVKHLLSRWTTELSGGERQRVALTRSLLSAPKLLLLDEPYSNLDLANKQILKQVIEDISNQLKISILMVSHEPDDLLPWAEEILILRQGRIIEKGTPEQLYRAPVHLYTAGLLGKYNIIPYNLLPGAKEEATTMILRPEDCSITSDKKKSGQSIAATVANSYYYGHSSEIELSLNDIKHRITVRTCEKRIYAKGEKVFIRMDFSRILQVEN